MTQEENIIIHRMARKSYDDWHGEVVDPDVTEMEFRRGYISGYVNLFAEITEELKLDIKSLYEKLNNG